MKRWLWVVVLVAGCPSPKAPAAGGFKVFYPDRMRFEAGIRIQERPAADCRYPDGREARWSNTGARVDQGELPPGLALEDGAIVGAPTTSGAWTVTIVFTGVTCGGKAQPDQRVTVPIRVKAETKTTP